VRLVTHRLSDHAGLLRKVCGIRMVEIVRVFERVSEDERRIELAVDIDHTVKVGFIEPQWIIAAVEEFNFGPEELRRTFGFVLAPGLYSSNRGARLLPADLAFAALAVRQADDLDPILPLGMERDRSTRAPDEIAGMCGDDKPGLLIRHYALL